MFQCINKVSGSLTIRTNLSKLFPILWSQKIHAMLSANRLLKCLWCFSGIISTWPETNVGWPPVTCTHVVAPSTQKWRWKWNTHSMLQTANGKMWTQNQNSLHLAQLKFENTIWFEDLIHSSQLIRLIPHNSQLKTSPMSRLCLMTHDNTHDYHLSVCSNDFFAFSSHSINPNNVVL